MNKEKIFKAIMQNFAIRYETSLLNTKVFDEIDNK